MKHLSTILLSALALNAGAQLSGTYTIGGTSPDFPSVSSAVNAIVGGGAVGNVIFDIRPGTYTGNYGLSNIPATPGSITFRNSSNGAQPVILEHDATGPTDNYIFLVDGTDGVFFQDLTFRPLDPVHARAIQFLNGIQLLSIVDCVFEGSTDPDQSAGSERALVWCDQNNLGSPDNPQDVMIMDNTFRNGYEAINLNFEGDFGNRSEGLIITGNTFVDQYATGITVNNAVGQIGDNLLTTEVGVFYTGIRAGYFDGGSQIRRNQVQAYSTSGGCTGMEVGNTQNTTGNMISNNMIYCHAPGDVWGLAVYNLWDMKIVHNSVLVAAGNQFQSYAFYHLSNFPDGQDALIRNNIFANNADGLAYMVGVAGNVALEDHNCLFSSGPVLAMVGPNAHATIAQLQAGTGLAVGDVSADPVFPIQPDLHLNDCTNALAGQYFFVMASDIDGDARGNPVCDMGADEFTFSTSINAGTIAITANDLPYTLVAPPGTDHQWNTGSTAQIIQVVTAGPYFCELTDVNGCSHTITWLVNVDFGTNVGEREGRSPTLYPVPAADRLYVTGAEPGSRYAVLDAQGRTVLQGAISTTAIDVQALAPGVYVLHYGVSGAWLTGRFVKQ